MVSERRIGTAEFQKHIQDLEKQVAVVIVNQQNVMSQLAEARDTLHDVVVELGGAPIDGWAKFRLGAWNRQGARILRDRLDATRREQQ